jgi:hypothetical protein
MNSLSATARKLLSREASLRSGFLTAPLGFTRTTVASQSFLASGKTS